MSSSALNDVERVENAAEKIGAYLVRLEALARLPTSSTSSVLGAPMQGHIDYIKKHALGAHSAWKDLTTKAEESLAREQSSLNTRLQDVATREKKVKLEEVRLTELKGAAETQQRLGDDAVEEARGLRNAVADESRALGRREGAMKAREDAAARQQQRNIFYEAAFQGAGRRLRDVEAREDGLAKAKDALAREQKDFYAEVNPIIGQNEIWQGKLNAREEALSRREIAATNAEDLGKEWVTAKMTDFRNKAQALAETFNQMDKTINDAKQSLEGAKGQADSVGDTING